MKESILRKQQKGKWQIEDVHSGNAKIQAAA